MVIPPVDLNHRAPTATCQNFCVSPLVERILATRPHPQQGYRSCLGILRLGKAYGADRLEAACQRALAIGGLSYKSIESILKHGLDQQRLPDAGTSPPPIPSTATHANVRGARYYQ